MEQHNGTSYENENQNKKIEELTDEQLKEVAGGMLQKRCPHIDKCLKQNANCNCTKCTEGFVLVSGDCRPQ